MSKRKKIGDIPVDAGCVMIVDPCYVLPFGDEDAPFTYEKFLEKMEETGYPDVLNMDFSEEHSVPLGFIVESGYGDGYYPVYVEYSDGRVSRITIEFIGDE